MTNHQQFYINGAWVAPSSPRTLDVINPATEQAYTRIAMGNPADVDQAVAAARAAFPAFSQTDKATRLALLRRILTLYNERAEEIAQAMSDEMGAPMAWARDAQTWAGRVHLEATITALEEYALAAGCTMVLKPSEIAPISGIVFSQIMHDAGVPAGVYNMVNGDGPSVGQVMAGHKDVDMVSFTGSTRAGVIVAKTAADTVKRVAQELGGKSPNIILDDADLRTAVRKGVESCMSNTGQSCDAPTRMLVPRALHAQALQIAAECAAEQVVGDPRDPATTMGPLVSQMQFDKVQALIQAGIDEGAQLVAGGVGRPEGLSRGYYVRPTVFGAVQHSMRISREEIFGPVLAILPYDSEAQAIEMANDTEFGLAAFVQSGSLERARAVGRQLRAGQVNINYPDWDVFAPFGGYKQSGNGREYADWGIHDFLEVKALIGYGA